MTEPRQPAPHPSPLGAPVPELTALRLHRRLLPVWDNEPGLRGWLKTTSNTRLGRMFLMTATWMFVVGDILAMLIRAQLASPRVTPPASVSIAPATPRSDGSAASGPRKGCALTIRAAVSATASGVIRTRSETPLRG